MPVAFDWSPPRATLAATLGSDTAAIAVEHVPSITASLAATLAGVSAALVGTSDVAHGPLAATLEGASAALTARHTIGVRLDATLAGVAASIVLSVPVSTSHATSWGVRVGMDHLTLWSIPLPHASHRATWADSPTVAASHGATWDDAPFVTAAHQAGWDDFDNVRQTHAAVWADAAPAATSHGASWSDFANARLSHGATWGDASSVIAAHQASWSDFANARQMHIAAWADAAPVIASHGGTWGDFANARLSHAATWADATPVTATHQAAWGDFANARLSHAALWADATPAATSHGALWGDFPSATYVHAARWADAAPVSASHAAVWDDFPAAAVAHATAWGNATPAAASHGGTWSDFANARQSHIASWIQITQSAASHVARWALAERPSAAASHTARWALLNAAALISIDNVPLVMHMGLPLRLLAATLSADEDSPVWNAETLRLAERADWVRIAIGDELILTVGAEVWRLKVDAKAFNRVHGEDVLTVSALSPLAWLDAPYAASLALDSQEHESAQAVVAALLAPVGAVDWQLPDWLIPPGALAITDATPLAAARAIVAAIGGVIESAPDGTPLARPRYPLSVPAYASATPDQSWLDNALFATTTRAGRLADFNRVLISNQALTGDEARDRLEYTAAADSLYAGTVRAWPEPWRAVVLGHTGHPDTAIAAQGEAVRTLTELVEFVGGAARVQYAIEHIVSVVWQHVDLGAVTASGADLQAATPAQSLAWITYTSRSLDWAVALEQDEAVQFVLI
jgi:hypothetical protein